MTSKCFSLTHIAAACAALFLFGCKGQPSDLPDLGQVSGTVTLDGQPLAGANVVFKPTTGSTSTGQTDAQGKYSLSYGHGLQGAVIGEHTVMISTYEMRINQEAGTSEEIPEKVPAKYNQQTTLKASVQAGENTADFALTSK